MQSPPRSERPSVAAAMVAAGALIAQQVAGKATRDALFLSNFNVESLPPVMMASALVAIVAVIGLSGALARRSPATVVPVAVATSAGLLAAEWGLSLSFPRAAAVLVYLHMALFGATLVSGFWSLVNERFDPYQARRVVGRIGMGASVGGVAGGLLALGVSRLIQVPTMLIVMAAINVVGLVALLKLRGSQPAAAAAQPAKEDGGAVSFLAGLRILRGVPYLRDMAVIVGLMALTETLLDYALNSTAAATFASGSELMFFFAMFHTGVGLVALAAQTTLARRCLEGLGLAGTVALLPISMVGGGLAGVLAPRLVSAVLARGVAGVLRNSLFRSGYELLFTPLAEAKKRPTKAIVDVGFDKLGSLVGGGAALAAVSLAPGAALRILFVACVAGALLAVALARRLHRGYVGALEESLRSGAVRLDSNQVFDSTTRYTLAQTGLVLERETLLREIQALRGETEADEITEEPSPSVDLLKRAVEGLRSAEAAEVRRVLTRSGEIDPRLAGFAIPLLARDDVFPDALRALRKIAPRVTGQLVDALVGQDHGPTVRRRIPRVLKACNSQRAFDGLLLGLEDGGFDVRQQCGVALARIAEHNPSIQVTQSTVFDLVRLELRASGRPSPPVGKEGERHLEHVFNLLALTLEREPLRISYWAVRSGDTLRGTALEYLENVLPDDVRQTLWPLLGVRRRPGRSRRPAKEVEDELIRTGSFSLSQLRKGKRPR